ADAGRLLPGAADCQRAAHGVRPVGLPPRHARLLALRRAAGVPGGCAATPARLRRLNAGLRRRRLMSTEPDTTSGPLRQYDDPAYRPLCANLGEVRTHIDRLDDAIVRLIAERAMYVKDAARFKRDAFQVSAPARQAQVFERARALARRHDQGFENLEAVV